MIVELRRYTLREGRRDELIDLFDREFVEPQEDLGMAVLGQFRDLDRPDRFVWLRGFVDLQSRRTGLMAFYSGAVWARRGPEANATMLDSDDVLLLHEIVALPVFDRGTCQPRLSSARDNLVLGAAGELTELGADLAEAVWSGCSSLAHGDVSGTLGHARQRSLSA